MARKHPTPEMVKDLDKVFKKHNWPGLPIGLTSKPGDLANRIVDNPDNDLCEDGSEPQWVTYKLPDGTWATKKMCP
jgi:hypothetical protein